MESCERSGSQRGRDHIPQEDRRRKRKQEKGQTPTWIPHAGGMAQAVWKRLPDRNLRAMNQFPWTLGDSLL